MIPEDWEIVEIGSLGKIITGKTPPTKDKDNFGCQYPFITPRDMKNQKYIENTERHLSEKGKNVVKNCLLSKDSVCVSCIGSDMGKVIMNKTDSITNQQINSIIPKIDSNYVYYALVNIYDRLRDMAFHSTAVPILNKSDFSKMKIAIPNNLEEAENIGYILSKLDDKIELNQKMNQTLEKIGQAIFKHWFIDFEFPDEDGKPYKSNGGEMVDSELGEIPKGWEISKLGEYTVSIKGCSYKSADLKESNNALVTLKSIGKDGNFEKNGFKEYVGDFNQRQVIIDGDIVIAQTDLTQKANVLGKPVIVRSVPQYETLIASLDLAIVRPKDKYLNKEFIYETLKTKTFHSHAVSYANGTTVLHLSKDAVPEYEMVIPHKLIIDHFGSILHPIFEKINFNNLESENLSKIRDSLLPKLMSGKIRVKGSETHENRKNINKGD